MPSAAPVKVRDIHNHHMNSTVWDHFQFRPDDIIIATYAKSGTTWLQQIVGQLLFGGQEDLVVSKMSPWVDLRVPAIEKKLELLEAQSHRRFLKTHLPLDALVFSESAKYIYIARDGRDVAWSLYNHHVNSTDNWYKLMNDSPGRIGPPLEKPDLDMVNYFRRWLKKDGFPFWSFWENIQTWWNYKSLPNILFLHFAELKADLRGNILKIADFLNIDCDESLLNTVAKYSSFDFMKENSTITAPSGGKFWKGGGKTFIHKGEVGYWKNQLTETDIRNYEETCISKLGAECSKWLNR